MNIKKSNGQTLHFQKNNIYDDYNRRIYALVGQNQAILDIGCATGKLLESLEKDKNCLVFGVEFDGKMADEAKKRCRNVFCLDIESCENLPFEKAFFDAIIFADVLEHLKRPDLVLKKLTPYLKQKGSLLISLPNMAFFSVRFGLLFGNFNYSEYGLLDKSHLRFFTLKTARKLIEDCGFKITQLEGYNQVRMRYFMLRPLGKIFKTFFATDFIIKAVSK
ncbi:MAG: class I SAM-dependent methyltransferase [Candidatus Omnitrophica bacterium]|nr:class I SAM-dependent methyltransferase [Candidatus Omnitrophota bacterium]